MSTSSDTFESNINSTSSASSTTTSGFTNYNKASHDHFDVDLALVPKERHPWSTGLFDCFSDFSNCCTTFWCPCVTFGRIAEIVDKGSSSCGVNGALYTLIACITGCCCIYSCFYRQKMRQHYKLKETPCADCLLHFFCSYCALCQEYRELQNRGYNMIIGWQGNVEKKNTGTEMPTVAPVFEAGMSR